ncbi:Soluble lytic murein transglycosylase precursor [Tsuneonella dongtanensis]|uniref:Soluble lytic murein transglycosylase n=1 Tax=Tsuneonella dongtanensis TaxID=692370 RepID=A0A1B2ABJ8_9SPHN|nr:lytic transglycosylase domain-containing protein [Tsuneonella dongtanensis]ANY19517.1 Soluble lytic murein transglycosylase precursor [Tsuneonella dongtanensis]
MILARAGIGTAIALLCAAAPAHADVMEIGPTGPRWISGALAVAPAPVEAAEDPGLVELSADFAVPPSAVADAAAQSGIVPALYAAKVAELARRFDLSPTLIEAVVWQESRWNAAARSPVGARGLAQLMPGTARYLGVNPDDPFANLEGGARYLREQMDRFDGDIEKALAAYNAGPGRVIAAGGIPRIRETQGYVAAIMGRLSDHSRKPN